MLDATSRYIRSPEIQVKYFRQLASVDKCYCPFCDEEKIQTQTTTQNNHAYVFRNEYPYKDAYDHLLIVPKRHVASIEECKIDEIFDMMALVAMVSFGKGSSGSAEILMRPLIDKDRSVRGHVHIHVIFWKHKHDTSI